MKFTAAGVTNCAAMIRSPSFSRSASSTTITMLALAQVGDDGLDAVETVFHSTKSMSQRFDSRLIDLLQWHLFLRRQLLA